MSLIFAITDISFIPLGSAKHLTTATTLGEDLVPLQTTQIWQPVLFPYSVKNAPPSAARSLLSQTLHSLKSPVRHWYLSTIMYTVVFHPVNDPISGWIHFRHKLIQLTSCSIQPLLHNQMVGVNCEASEYYSAAQTVHSKHTNTQTTTHPHIMNNLWMT